MLRKFKIPFITAWHGHNGSCAINCQYILTDVNRNFLAAKRIDCIGTCKATRDFFLCHPVYIAAAFYIRNILVHGCGLFRTFYLLHQIQLWRRYHKINTKNGVRSCCINLQFHRLTPGPSPSGEGSFNLRFLIVIQQIYYYCYYLVCVI